MTSVTPIPDVDAVARAIAARMSGQFLDSIRQLLQSGGTELDFSSLQLECSLSTNSTQPGEPRRHVHVASLNLAGLLDSASPLEHLEKAHSRRDLTTGDISATRPRRVRSPGRRSLNGSSNGTPEDSGSQRSPKRRKATGGLRVGPAHDVGTDSQDAVRRLESNGRIFPQRKKRLPDNPALQPSTLDKFVSGVWDSLFSRVKLDPTEVVEQWQAIESNGQPRLLADVDQEVATRSDTAIKGHFARINVLTRKISQTSRTFRSLEVIVQTYWIQCFDDRVAELSASLTRDKAKKAAVAEACADMNWSEKELRNKMAIWRGYHEIKTAGSWAALVFAGMGLYRFCKYRVSFTEETFQTLRSLKHRFEVAADTLHPRWRHLLGIISGPTERKYTGHPHDWVVCGGHSNNEALYLPQTYVQWDANFSYVHISESVLDEEAWGTFDPRTTETVIAPTPHTCQVCNETQSTEPARNRCNCFPNLYGPGAAGAFPVQVYRTPNGKNNGLLACCAFERGVAVGEFVGEITSGLENLDVMVGQTEQASYQIWQGRQGNHTRFINHSCQPNSQFERFVWLGTQRVVLVSKGVEAGQEITVDYSDTYWKNLDKICLCREPRCRYRNREQNVLPSPESDQDEIAAS